MKCITFIVAILVSVFSTSAFARSHHRHYVSAHQDCNILWPCTGVVPSPRGERVVRAMGGFGSAKKVYRRQRYASADYRHRVIHHRHHKHQDRIPSSTVITGIVPPLASKVSEIVSTCGSRIVSGVRHTLIAGTRHMSLHASGKAVDVAGNPSCIYSMLHDWRGGYSIDYGRVRHVHISYDPDGGREMGVRFVHGGWGHRRYAHRHHHHHYAHRHQRYASAQ